jgi:hypothetical protein
MKVLKNTTKRVRGKGKKSKAKNQKSKNKVLLYYVNFYRQNYKSIGFHLHTVQILQFIQYFFLPVFRNTYVHAAE